MCQSAIVETMHEKLYLQGSLWQRMDKWEWDELEWFVKSARVCCVAPQVKHLVQFMIMEVEIIGNVWVTM